MNGAYFDVTSRYGNIFYKTNELETSEQGNGEDKEMVFATQERFGFCVWYCVTCYSYYASFCFKSESLQLLGIFGDSPEAVKYIINYLF